MWIVRLDYLNDENDPSVFYAVPAFVGPFASKEEAVDYVEAYPEGDEELVDINVFYMNPLSVALKDTEDCFPATSLMCEHWARRVVGKEFE
jgi:hypothetical protein